MPLGDIGIESLASLSTSWGRYISNAVNTSFRANLVRFNEMMVTVYFKIFILNEMKIMVDCKIFTFNEMNTGSSRKNVKSETVCMGIHFHKN